jgi:hypothetical protein
VGRTYRAVNTLRLGYGNQSVNAVQWNNRCLFVYPQKKINIMRGLNVPRSKHTPTRCAHTYAHTNDAVITYIYSVTCCLFLRDLRFSHLCWRGFNLLDCDGVYLSTFRETVQPPLYSAKQSSNSKTDKTLFLIFFLRQFFSHSFPFGSFISSFSSYLFYFFLPAFFTVSTYNQPPYYRIKQNHSSLNFNKFVACTCLLVCITLRSRQEWTGY